MTVLDVIQRSTNFLARKGVDSPRLQVELLLAHLLGLPRMKLYLNFERALNDAELSALRESVLRRANREPLQHIIGSTSFCGLELEVNPHVLIPRPETELLAERAWEFVQHRARPSPTVLDFGTGSGCLAVAIAVHCPAARFHALEISREAIEVARRNAARHNVQERMLFHCGDSLAVLPPELQFDLIVSNPPYIPTTEIESLQPEVRDHDPRPALDGGDDGLRFHRTLAATLPGRLADGGRVMLEFGDGQADAVRGIFETHGWIVDEVVSDLNRQPRFIVAGRS